MKPALLVRGPALLVRMRPALLVAMMFLLAPLPARAQSAPPDTMDTASPPPTAKPTAAPADTAAPSPATAARRARAAVGRDSHRFELGTAVVDGPYDLLGTFAYHRYARRGGPFENWIHLEIAGAKTTYLNEGAFSAAYLVRPVLFIHRDWTIRPIVEVGPAGHIVVQVAEVEGFGETAFHSHAYLKTHAFAGFDVPLGGGWGIVARGRFTVPAHQPFDYAQIALFFR